LAIKQKSEVVTHIVLFTKTWTIRKCLLPASNIKLPSSCTKWWLGQPSINQLLCADDIRLVGTNCCVSVGLNRYQPYHKITICYRIVSNWEQAVRTHLVDRLWDLYVCSSISYLSLSQNALKISVIQKRLFEQNNNNI
jgi:hypothetical protein